MKNTTESIQIIKNKQSGEILGYILPNESCLMSAEYVIKKHRFLPNETPENVVEVE